MSEFDDIGDGNFQENNLTQSGFSVEVDAAAELWLRSVDITLDNFKTLLKGKTTKEVISRIIELIEEKKHNSENEDKIVNEILALVAGLDEDYLSDDLMLGYQLHTIVVFNYSSRENNTMKYYIEKLIENNSIDDSGRESFILRCEKLIGNMIKVGIFIQEGERLTNNLL